MASIKFNSQKLRDYLNEHSMTMQGLSYEMGRSESFVSYAISRGYMSEVAYNVMCKTLGVAPRTFTEVAPSTYHLALTYSESKVLVQLMCGDEVVSGAWALVKEPGDLGFIQAISYAAHMMYKFAQQDDLNKEELA